MQIILNNSSMTPIYEQLVSQIKSQILDGVLITDAPLPSVRSLASELKISALTVKKAYDFLEDEGFVVTVHGKGTYVAAVDLQFSREHRLKNIEDEFAQVIDKARACGMSTDDIRETIALLLDDYT